jgi:hypothetical protein
MTKNNDLNEIENFLINNLNEMENFIINQIKKKDIHIIKITPFITKAGQISFFTIETNKWTFTIKYISIMRLRTFHELINEIIKEK